MITPIAHKNEAAINAFINKILNALISVYRVSVRSHERIKCTYACLIDKLIHAREYTGRLART